MLTDLDLALVRTDPYALEYATRDAHAATERLGAVLARHDRGRRAPRVANILAVLSVSVSLATGAAGLALAATGTHVRSQCAASQCELLAYRDSGAFAYVGVSTDPLPHPYAGGTR